MNTSDIGHNQPPEVLELVPDVIRDISQWMADNPVVADEDTARQMKPYIDRAKHCIKDLEAERKGKTRPLEATVMDINQTYRSPRRMLGDLLDEMLRRGEEFIKAEEIRRHRLAMQAANRAREAERLALEAEKIERDRLDDASKGEVGVDVAEITAHADQAFEDYQRAERQAILTQKETHVKISGGFSRAMGLRAKETLHVDQPMVAIMMMGITEDIKEAILKSARAYRKVHGKLPDGISATVEKHL